MKKLIFSLLVLQVTISMEKENKLPVKENIATYAVKKDFIKRTIGQAIHNDDDKYKQRIQNIAEVREREAVAFVFRGRLIYGEVTHTPETGKAILISNRHDSDGDPIPHGRAYDISNTPIYKLPPIFNEGTDK